MTPVIVPGSVMTCVTIPGNKVDPHGDVTVDIVPGSDITLVATVGKDVSPVTAPDTNVPPVIVSVKSIIVTLPGNDVISVLMNVPGTVADVAIVPFAPGSEQGVLHFIPMMHI